MKVPIIDLKVQYKSIKYEIDSVIQEVVDSCAFAGGPFVAKFERRFAEYCDARYAVGVGSGTDAIWIALRSLGIGPGDEVITVPFTFIATIEAITYCGAKPVFVDVDESTATMDPSLVEAAISSRTKAIVPVHLYGQSADMDAILAIAREYDIPVVEDAAQAHGARYQGKAVGTLGDAGCFSFYPGKNLGAFGEAGAVATNDEALAERMSVFRNHGQPQKYHHDVAGWNGRMDGIQAAVLTVKLAYLDGWNKLRREHAEHYNRLLAELYGVRLLHAKPHNQHVYHQYVVRVENRDEVVKRLDAGGIGCAIHYPVPVHLTGAYSHLGYTPGDFPISEKLASQVISLPMFAELRDTDIQQVVDKLASCIRQAV